MGGQSQGMLFGGDVYRNIKWIIKELRCQRSLSEPIVFLPFELEDITSEEDVLSSVVSQLNNLDTVNYSNNTIPVFFISNTLKYFTVSLKKPFDGPTIVGAGHPLDVEDVFILAESIQDFNSFSVYVNTNLAPETIGGFLEGEPITPPEGLTQEEFNDKLFLDIILPSISFNVNNQIIEKGTDFSQTVNITFSQNDAGALIGYSLEKDGIEVSTTQSTAFTANNVIQNFTLQAKVSHDAGDSISAGTISTALRTIIQVVPQWKGQKSNSTSLNNSTYNALNSALTKIVQNGDNTSITVTAGNYGFFLSINPNATIIEDGTGFAIAPSAFTKNTITAKLANGSDFTLTEYIINPATGDFTYNLQ